MNVYRFYFRTVELPFNSDGRRISSEYNYHYIGFFNAINKFYGLKQLKLDSKFKLKEVTEFNLLTQTWDNNNT